MKFFILSTLLALVSCQKKDNATSTAPTDPLIEAVESSLNMISGSMDDGAEEAVVSSRFNPLELLIQRAHAASCTRQLSGTGGVCSRNVNCEAGPFSWSGNVTLTFANGSSCSLSGVGDSFVREVAFERAGPRGTLQTTSGTQANYLGQPVSGGIRLESVSGGYELEVLGQSKIFKNGRGEIVFDVSSSTTSPLAFNQLGRDGRILSSGTLEVYHNRAEFTVSKTFNNLEWASGCCHPTAGTIHVSLTGSRTGSGTITFNGCGSVTTDFETAKSFTLAFCE